MSEEGAQDSANPLIAALEAFRQSPPKLAEFVEAQLLPQLTDSNETAITFACGAAVELENLHAQLTPLTAYLGSAEAPPTDCPLEPADPAEMTEPTLSHTFAASTLDDSAAAYLLLQEFLQRGELSLYDPRGRAIVSYLAQ